MNDPEFRVNSKSHAVARAAGAAAPVAEPGEAARDGVLRRPLTVEQHHAGGRTRAFCPGARKARRKEHGTNKGTSGDRKNVYGACGIPIYAQRRCDQMPLAAAIVEHLNNINFHRTRTTLRAHN